MAKNRLERNWDDDNQLPVFYLDILAYRRVSDEITRVTGVKHESPQLLVWKNGKVVYHASHNAINVHDLEPVI